MAPPTKGSNDFSEQILLENSLERIGRLEGQVSELLPSVAQVAASCSRIDQSLLEIKESMSSVTRGVSQLSERVTSGFFSFKESLTDLGGRVDDLEKLKEEAKQYALAERKAHEDRRGKILSIVGGAAASFLVAVLVWFFGIR